MSETPEVEKVNLKGKNLPLNYSKLYGVYSVTSGLVLNQVLEITNLDSSVIHNWINRGFISRPKEKKYDFNQVSRILIIDLLRPAMTLEDITSLLTIINGDVEDTSDDIISDSKLYEYIYKMVKTIRDFTTLNILKSTDLINEITMDFEEIVPGSIGILKDALEVIFYAYISVITKEEVAKKLRKMEKTYL